MSDKKILSQGVMNFFSKKEECRSLSNFWECNIVIEDGDDRREYSSGESCFHGEKFIRVGKLCKDENRKRALLEYGSRFFKGICENNGAVVKKMGRRFILDKDELELWSILSIDVQNEICRYKYENYVDVRDDLAKSRGKVLIHPAMRCGEEKIKSRLWEGKAIVVDGKIQVIGKNMLGNLWMKIRDNE
jgi:predicted NAD-dependent protein-ADP-ribosyltransferase YbiA (DUF1768 family)